jgi:hypothetical protein
MKIAIYQRVSTGRQDPENQGAQLREFAKRQSWTIAHEFTDIVSGMKGEGHRPQFKRLMEAASRREVDLVLFWALDRFSREGVLPTLHHLQRLDSWGVAWRSYTEQYLDSHRHLQRRCDLNHGDNCQAGKSAALGKNRGRIAASEAQRLQVGLTAGQHREGIAHSTVAQNQRGLKAGYRPSFPQLCRQMISC